MNKEEIIKRYKLKPHQEGGYFTETYHSNIRFNDKQFLYSSLIFLLGKGDISHFHRLEEDELWYYQAGDDCTIIDIDENYYIKEIKLGISDVNSTLQYLVKKGHIFGSKYAGDTFTLVGCMVSPSFTYKHFKLISKSEIQGKIDEQQLSQLLEMFIS